MEYTCAFDEHLVVFGKHCFIQLNHISIKKVIHFKENKYFKFIWVDVNFMYCVTYGLYCD
jgi:hypothetical protein